MISLAEINIVADRFNVPAETSVMTLNTLLANKLGLLMDSTRNEPRDLLDIQFLLQRIHQFDFNFARVCEIFKKKYGFHPSLNSLLPLLKNNSLKIHWSKRLNKQISELPDITVVIKDIEAGLRKLFRVKRSHG